MDGPVGGMFRSALQPTVNSTWSVLPRWGGVDKPLSCTGNSLAEEPHLCLGSLFQGCTDLPLVGFQQLGTVSFRTPGRDVGEINSGICHINILCSLQGLR